MSIEGFNIKKTRSTKAATLYKFMSATEARNELNVIVANLAEIELEKAIENVKKSIAEARNITTFAFTYGSSPEVIAATIGMLLDLDYEVEISNYYNDVINITVK